MNINFLTFSSILNIIAGVLMAILFFNYHNNRKPAIIWGFVAILAALWGIGVLIVSLTNQIETALIGWQIAYIAVILGPVGHHHFVLSYIKSNNRKQLLILYSIATIILAISFFANELFIPDLKYVFNEFYYLDWVPHKSILYLSMYIGFYWGLLLYSFVLLLNYLRTCPAGEKKQLKYVILGSFIVWVGAHGDFPLVFGFELYPYSNILFTIGCLTIGYGVIRHQAFDIKVALQNSFAFSVTVSLISVIFLVSVILFERFFQGIIGYKTTYGSILSAVAIALLFTPLRNRIQEIVEKYFFKGSHAEIAQQNELLRAEVIKTEKLKTISTLASGVAHEIRNPLTALKTFVEYFPQKKNDPEFIAKFEKIAGSEICRIESILNELLAFAKPSPLALTDTDIKKTLEHALNLTTNQLSKNNVTVKADFADHLPQIKADTNKLLQVFINLIINANDAMPNGGTLHVTARHCEPEGRGNLTISISDTGCGIDPKDLAKIFEPFFSTKEKGTGLGLAIVKGIIEDHEGKITVKSEKDAGTTFAIALPTPGDSN